MIARASGLKTPEYICYALGDAGGCLVFGLVTSILQTYYTDVLILSQFFIMVMFVLTRVWDAVNDPIMGRICDTAPVSKHGRYRVWFLRVAFPLAIASILLFLKFDGFGTPGDNLPAYKCYESIGFHKGGELEDHYEDVLGEKCKVVELEIKKEEWQCECH